MERETQKWLLVPMCFLILSIYSTLNFPPLHEDVDFTGIIVDKYDGDHFIIRNGTTVIVREVRLVTYNSYEINNTITVTVKERVNVSGHWTTFGSLVGMFGTVFFIMMLIYIDFSYRCKRISREEG